MMGRVTNRVEDRSGVGCARGRPWVSGVLWALLLLVVGACSSAEVAGEATNELAESPTELAVPGGTQQVWCAGEGPAVILLNGIGDDAGSGQWQAVQDGLASEAKVCRYDRPGTGASAPSTAGRGPDDLIAELDAVVDHAAGSDPVILVGHSFGGYLARLYGQAHPDRVSGIVFVDALDPSIGLVRGTGAPQLADVPMAEEQLDLAAIEAAAEAITALPGDPPLTVLSRGRDLSADWESAQTRLAALSADATIEVVADAGHQVPTDAPQAVIAAVLAMQDE